MKVFIGSILILILLMCCLLCSASYFALHTFIDSMCAERPVALFPNISKNSTIEVTTSDCGATTAFTTHVYLYKKAQKIELASKYRTHNADIAKIDEDTICIMFDGEGIIRNICVGDYEIVDL